MKKTICLLIVLNSLLGLNLATSSALAHPSTDFYSNGVWFDDRRVQYSIDNSVPDAWVPRITTGLNRWSDRSSGRSPQFAYIGRANSYDGNQCTGENTIARTGDGGTGVGNLGLTDLCYDGRVIVGFGIQLNNSPGGGGWYAGTGDPGATQWDVQSIATHESGHATGWLGHFNEASSYCPSNSGAQTMCQGEALRRGTSYLRTLEDHDIHTLENAY